MQVAQPVALAAYLKDCCTPCEVCCRIPDGICRRYGGTFDCTCRRGVYIALGLFTIVQIVRNVQMLIPTYDFCIPEKECTGSTSDSPATCSAALTFLPTNSSRPRPAWIPFVTGTALARRVPRALPAPAARALPAFPAQAAEDKVSSRARRARSGVFPAERRPCFRLQPEAHLLRAAFILRQYRTEK